MTKRFTAARNPSSQPLAAPAARLLRTPRAAALALGALAAAALWAAVPQTAQAADWQVSAGTGDRASIKKVGFGVVWDPHPALWQGNVWQLRLLHEAQVAYWDVPHAKDIVEIGYSPVLRLQRGTASAGSWSPFIEASIGVRAISHTRLSESTTMSTAFQFSDVIGAGVQFGNRLRSTVGIRYQHLSNASIKRPNPGINFTQLYYQQSF